MRKYNQDNIKFTEAQIRFCRRKFSKKKKNCTWCLDSINDSLKIKTNLKNIPVCVNGSNEISCNHLWFWVISILLIIQALNQYNEEKIVKTSCYEISFVYVEWYLNECLQVLQIIISVIVTVFFMNFTIIEFCMPVYIDTI